MRRRIKGKYSDVDWEFWAKVACLAVVVVWVVTSGIKPVVESVRKAREVVYKTREYKRLAEENRRAEAELEFLNTVEGKAWAVRSELRYIDEGEKVLELSEEQPSALCRRLGDHVRARLGGVETGIRRWGRDAIDIGACLLGLWEPVMPEEHSLRAGQGT